MNDSMIKEALAYSLGSDLHEVWRSNRKLEDGTFEPRIKKSKDEEWNIKHGTDEVDIANCSFAEFVNVSRETFKEAFIDDGRE